MMSTAGSLLSSEFGLSVRNKAYAFGGMCYVHDLLNRVTGLVFTKDSSSQFGFDTNTYLIR